MLATADRDEADALLVRLWSERKTLEEIGAVLRITKQSVMRRARRLRAAGVELEPRSPGWTSPQRHARYHRHDARNAEILALASLPRSERPTLQEIAVRLGLSRDAVSSVLRRARKAGLADRLIRRWSPADDAALKRYRRDELLALARRFDRTPAFIRSRLAQLGLADGGVQDPPAGDL